MSREKFGLFVTRVGGQVTLLFLDGVDAINEEAGKPTIVWLRCGEKLLIKESIKDLLKKAEGRGILYGI